MRARITMVMFTSMTAEHCTGPVDVARKFMQEQPIWTQNNCLLYSKQNCLEKRGMVAISKYKYILLF